MASAFDLGDTTSPAPFTTPLNSYAAHRYARMAQGMNLTAGVGPL